HAARQNAAVGKRDQGRGIDDDVVVATAGLCDELAEPGGREQLVRGPLGMAGWNDVQVEGRARLDDGVQRKPGVYDRARNTAPPLRPAPAARRRAASVGFRRAASMIRTRAFASWARAPARLMAVVVFPSPMPGLVTTRTPRPVICRRCSTR